VATIFARTVAGRLARVSPTGKFIPNDRFIPVEMTPYVDRLLNVHRDIETTTDPERPAPRSKPPRPVKPVDNPPPPPVATAD
jgi:hypothetical protein